MTYRWVFVLCLSIVLQKRSEAFVVPSWTWSKALLSIRTSSTSNSAAPLRLVPPVARCASMPRTPRRPRYLRMDDEIARQGIKEELTTRDEYLATRFTKLSASGHDLTPFTPEETQVAASHLRPEQKAVLLGSTTEEDVADTNRGWRDHREKGLYACAVGGLPLFTSGWKLEPRATDSGPSFAVPCDDEHLLEGHDAETGATYVSCTRSRVRVGKVIDDPASPSGKRYLIMSAALEFHPLGTPLPVRSQPENYWGSEGQYRAWILE